MRMFFARNVVVKMLQCTKMAFANAMDVVFSGMKTESMIISITLIMLSCGRGKSVMNDVTDGGHGIGIDTMTVNEIKQIEDSNITNMHGFDPISEDDMEDNGISRYMENNDEIGWR